MCSLSSLQTSRSHPTGAAVYSKHSHVWTGVGTGGRVTSQTEPRTVDNKTKSFYLNCI